MVHSSHRGAQLLYLSEKAQALIDMVRQSVQALKITIKIWSVPVSNIRVRKHLCLPVKVGEKLKSAD